MSSLDARYGRTPTRARRGPAWVPVAAVLGTVGLTWLLWAAWSASREQVTAQLTGYEVVSPSRVEVRIQVYRRGGEAVRCEVYAQAADRSIVGQRSVDLPVGAEGSTVLTAAITTERPAVNGALGGCQAVAGS